MKGIVFDLLQQVVTTHYGDEAWDGLLDASSLEGAYTAVGSYPDEELMALVHAACESTGLTEDKLIRWFGSECIPLLSTKYPQFFEPHTATMPFLLTLNEVIHPEVRKLFPGAYAPSFQFDLRSDNVLALAYHSHRNLCAFAEGLIDGSAAHYGETVSIEQETCSKRGDERCLMVATFGEPADG